MPPSSRGARLVTRYPKLLPPISSFTRSIANGRNRFLCISEEVQDAVHTGKPVVALETTIYTHGYPHPENLTLSSHLESLVRVNGGIPATIGVLNGIAHVGMNAEEIIELVSSAGQETTLKLSRRDLGFITGFGLRGQKLNGGTTVAGTMVLAHLAGIKVFATGGLGGVHRGGENSMDISADLTELGRTPVAVVSSGCKSFLDIPRTLEYLETQGVPVGTFADGRQGRVQFPAFWSRDSGLKSPMTIRDEVDAAAVIYAQVELGMQNGLLFANPVPKEVGIEKSVIDKVISQAVDEAEQQAISGSANTPFVLKRIRELTNNGSVTANTALIEANVVRGTKVAVELAKLERRGGAAPERTLSARCDTTAPPPITQANTPVVQSITTPLDVLVAGSLASDTTCDYIPLTNGTPSAPVLETSNPSSILQSAGGVGRNVATAAHFAGARVGLATVVADDLAGSSLLDQLAKDGMSTSYVKTLGRREGARTAQYVAINDVKRDLVLAMSDMAVLDRPEMESPQHWDSVMQKASPKWLVVDGNWSPTTMSTIFETAKQKKIPTAFEPVSTAKAVRLFDKQTPSIKPSHCIPNHVVNLTTPNALELTAMYTAARENGYFGSEHWWKAIDGFGLSSSGSQDKFVSIASSNLVQRGIPQQTIQLLPYIPSIVTKLGAKGCLLTQILRPQDPRLRDPDFAPFIVARNIDSDVVGGVYMRLFAPFAVVPDDQVVSVNGIGDTLLGVLVAGLAQGRLLENILPLSQEAAVLSLKSKEAVSPDVRLLADRLR